MLLKEAKYVIDDDFHAGQRSEEMTKKSKNMLVTCCGYVVCAAYKLLEVLFDYITPIRSAAAHPID